MDKLPRNRHHEKDESFREACWNLELHAGICQKNIKVTEAILKTKKKILEQLHPKREQETN